MQEVLCDFVIQCLTKGISSRLLHPAQMSGMRTKLDMDHDALIELKADDDLRHDASVQCTLIGELLNEK